MKHPLPSPGLFHSSFKPRWILANREVGATVKEVDVVDLAYAAAVFHATEALYTAVRATPTEFDDPCLIQLTVAHNDFVLAMTDAELEHDGLERPSILKRVLA